MEDYLFTNLVDGESGMSWRKPAMSYAEYGTRASNEYAAPAIRGQRPASHREPGKRGRAGRHL